MSVIASRTSTTRNELVSARLERGLTRKALAQRSGVSYRTIQRIEAGKEPSDSVLIRLADALELAPTTVQRWFST
jgi:transcriptional regulator with XRE-family HTH domain